MLEILTGHYSVGRLISRKAKEYGVMERSTLKSMKDRISNGEKFNFWTKEERILVSAF